MERLHDFTDHAARHHLAQGDVGCVPRSLAHAAALVGIEREIGHLDQHLAVLGFGHRRFLDAEV